MQQKQKEIVRQTWKQLVPIADTSATLFYQRLFEIDPSTRPLFSGTDMPEQRRKLMQVIGLAVNGLDQSTESLQSVAQLGARPLNYGVTDKHYESVGQTLLWAFGQGIGETFNTKVKEALDTRYGLVTH